MSGALVFNSGQFSLLGVGCCLMPLFLGGHFCVGIVAGTLALVNLVEEEVMFLGSSSSFKTFC
jgi:hypothetical protein